MVEGVKTPNTPQEATSHTEASPLQPHAAAPQNRLEAAEPMHADLLAGVPTWQPETGDFA
jgi:hypothetical protein